MYNQPDTLRRISSRLTFITKFISPVLALIAAAYVLFPISGTPLPLIGFMLLFVAAIMGYSLWTSYRIKAVKADSNNLYVSNFFKETTIPLDQIAAVTEFVWIEPRIVTIHLRAPSEFGQKIAFMATYRFYAFYSPHPIVAELQQMAGFETYKEIKDTWLS